MSASEKIRWRRLLNELSYLSEEKDFVESIVKESSVDFQQHYSDFCDRMSFNIDSLNERNAEKIRRMYGINAEDMDIEETKKALTEAYQEIVKYTEPPVYNTNPSQAEEPAGNEYQMTQDEQELHESFNKVFRQIAMILHPDKLDGGLSDEQRNAKIDKFNLAKRSLEERKYFVLLDMAKEFNIKTPRNYKQQIRWMKKEIETLKVAIGNGKTTYNYIFAECESEPEKDALVKKFMQQLFGINF